MARNVSRRQLLGIGAGSLAAGVAWASEEAMRALWAQVVGHIENFNAGRPSNVVV